MNEQEWLACTDPQEMLWFLRGKVSQRKARLVLCGWSRLNWRWLPREGRAAVEAAERFADGLLTDQEREDAEVAFWWATKDGHNPIRHWWARLTLEGSLDFWAAADDSVSSNPTHRGRQIGILRDAFGDLFCPMALDPSWLSRNDAAVARLARAIYEERAFHNLPILADALEEAGCRAAAILNHLRGPGPHVKGCHVLDLLLRKE